MSAYTLEDIVRDITSIPNAGDGNLVLNLAELIKAVGQVHHIVTRIPAALSDNHLNHHALSIWANKILAPHGLYILIGTMDTIPVNVRSLMPELEFIGVATLNANEIVVIFEKPSKSWFLKASIRRFWSNIPKHFKNGSDLIAQLTRNNEVILLPFSMESKDIGQTTRDLNRTYIKANCAAKSVDFVASVEVCK